MTQKEADRLLRDLEKELQAEGLLTKLVWSFYKRDLYYSALIPNATHGFHNMVPNVLGKEDVK